MSLVKANGAGEVSTGFYNGVIGQSLRFDSASSSYLQDTASGTPSSTTNRAVSFWVKRSKLSTNQILLNGHVSGPNVTDFINFRSDDTIMIYVDMTAGGSDETNWQTTAKFRDTANWYHIFVKYTLSESSNADKVKLYVNGSQQTLTATQTGNAVTSSRLLTNGTIFRISNYFDNRYYLDGYLAEYNVIDGDADHTDFGETKNGVWIAKAYSGSYGNSGFRLTFEANGTSTTDDGTDNSSNMTNIGDDKSGNGNNFAVYNLVGDDIFPDTPENNFATFNFPDLRNNASLSQGATQLDATTYSGGNYGQCALTIPVPPSGKWYIECHIESSGSSGGNLMCFGVVDRNDMTVSASASNYYNTTGLGFTGQVNQLYLTGTLNYYYNVSDGSYSGYNVDRSFTSQEAIIAMAIDVDNGYIYFGRDAGTGNTGSQITWRKPSDGTTGTSNVNPESGSSGTGGIARTFNNNTVIIVDVSVDGGNVYKIRSTINAGQDSSFAGKVTAQNETDGNGQGDFYYSVPSGYLALCSANLPDVTIGPTQSSQADDFFNTVLYSGANNATQSITDVGFQPDWSWFKSRSNASDHYLYDSPRGANKSLNSNKTAVEDSTSGQFTQFTATGFDLPADSAGYVNYTGRTYVAWNWRAGGGPTADNSAGAGNTPTSGSVKIDGSNKSDALAGTIAATRLTANTTSGFSVITYTGNNGSSGTIAHGLNSAPEWVLVFGRNVSNSQMLGVTPMGFTKYASFQTTGGYFVADSTIWNDTAPTSTVFTVGSAANVNDAYNYVAYCFHSVEGYSKIGTYLGNGNTSSDGPYVYLGFRPAWLFVKRTNDTGGAIIWDNKRSTSNPTDDYLVPQLQDDEELNNSTQRVDFLSNGFKVKNGATSNSINGSGSTYLYLAFAEQPFKFSNAR